MYWKGDYNNPMKRPCSQCFPNMEEDKKNNPYYAQKQIRHQACEVGLVWGELLWLPHPGCLKTPKNVQYIL